MNLDFFGDHQALRFGIGADDRMAVGTGAVGVVTRALQDAYFAVVEGRVAAKKSWLTPVWNAQ